LELILFKLLLISLILLSFSSNLVLISLIELLIALILALDASNRLLISLIDELIITILFSFIVILESNSETYVLIFSI